MWAVIRPWRWLQESEICDVEIPDVPARKQYARPHGTGAVRALHGGHMGILWATGSHDAMGLIVSSQTR